MIPVAGLNSNRFPPPADSDHDGMPDKWEKANGLNPKNPKDGNAISKDGYTNLENYPPRRQNKL